MRKWIRWFVIGLVVLPILACDVEEPTPTRHVIRPTATRRTQRTPTPKPTRPTPRPTATPYPTPDPSAIDSDGDLFPDEVEEAMGDNPARNECLEKVGCGVNTAVRGGIMNVLFIFDASAGMGNEIQENPKIVWARKGMESYLKAVPSVFNMGLMVYGHRGDSQESGREVSCAGIDVFYPIGPIDRATLKSKIHAFSSQGWAPLAGALELAKKTFTGREGQTNRLVLVTVGGDTCGGDPCRVAQELKQSGVAVSIDVIAFGVDDAGRSQLQCMTNATGGAYYQAQTTGELAAVWEALIEREKQWFKDASCISHDKTAFNMCQSERSLEFNQWANSSGWVRTHIEQVVGISEKITEENMILSVPQMPTPTP